MTLTASYIPREKKLELLGHISQNIDCLKYFITLLWELKALDTNKYSQLAEKLSSIGKMIGGWLRELKQPRS